MPMQNSGHRGAMRCSCPIRRKTAVGGIAIDLMGDH